MVTDATVAFPMDVHQTSREEHIMSTRLRHGLVAFATAIALAVTAAPASGSAATLADGVCPAGTNWDNSIHACR